MPEIRPKCRHIVPIVRAAAIAPFLSWMRANGIAWETRLQAAGLPTGLLEEPERPIPLIAGARFIRDASRAHGPDIGCRVVSDTSIAELAALGRVALGARTPRGAFRPAHAGLRAPLVARAVRRHGRSGWR